MVPGRSVSDGAQDENSKIDERDGETENEDGPVTKKKPKIIPKYQ